MKKLLLLYSLFCWAAVARAQYSRDASVDYVLQHMPKSAAQSTAGIAQYFNQQFTSPAQKLEAIYAWVTTNIKYASDSATIINWNANTQLKVTEALRRRKGVCENYTAIFHDIANQCGLLTAEVDGYTKQNGSIDRSGHSWLAVQLNNQWLLCDPTWDKDSYGQYRYFLVAPQQLIQSHMPFDFMWQLLQYPITHKDFINGNTGADKKKPAYHYADSIAAFLALDSLQQLQARQLRILQAGPANELVTLTAAATNMKIRIINEVKMESLYNEAVTDFNKGLQLFNSYLQDRNNGKLPPSRRQLLELIGRVEAHVMSAKNNIIELEAMYNNFQYDPNVLKNRINSLEERIKKEQQAIGTTLAGK